MDMKGKRASDDENLSRTIEELEILKRSVVSKHSQLDETVKKLRLLGGKKKSNRKIVELEKMLSISRDENFALKIKIDEMEKCMEEKEEELKDLKSFNQNIMVMERKNNHENQEDRKELIKSMLGRQGCLNVGVKRSGESDLAPFAAALKKRKCSGSGPQKAGLEWNSGADVGGLCSLWEKYLRDPGWHPFRIVKIGDKYQEIIDDEDPKLKGLKSEFGEDAYNAVTTRLMEMNEYNPSRRYPVSEIWNFIEGRKVSLKEGFSFVFEKLKYVGNIVVSSLSIAATNPSSSAPGPNIAATNPSSSAPSYQDPCEIQDVEFHDFIADKSYGKFRAGQIWALYCDLDELPRYYVQITRVKFNPDFELHVQHLNSSHSPKCQLQWADKNMPICCGAFKVGQETVVYKDMEPFSHQCRSKLIWRGNYEIYPRRGEVWAMYKDFDSKWTCSDLKNCKYDIVEVLGNKGSRIKVLVMEKVTGLKTVFKPKENSGVDIIKWIKQAMFLAFSHQIPAFRLTDEKEGSLRGYWELDPNSIPVYLLSSN